MYYYVLLTALTASVDRCVEILVKLEWRNLLWQSLEEGAGNTILYIYIYVLDTCSLWVVPASVLNVLNLI